MPDNIKLTDARDTELGKFYKMLQKNFAEDEIRTEDSIYEMFKCGKLHILKIEYQGKECGYLSYYKLSDFYFVEHFVIDDAYKCRGIGGNALDLFSESHFPLILEAEPPENSIKARRIHFYERHGFCVVEREYIQPAYAADKSAVRLLLLSYPTLPKDIEATVREIYSYVYKGFTIKF